MSLRQDNTGMFLPGSKSETDLEDPGFRGVGWMGGRNRAQVEMDLSLMPSFFPPRQEGSFCEQDVRFLLRLR